LILVDANLLLYAEDSLSEQHERARTWWDSQLSGAAPVGLCWSVIVAFIRISTNTRLHQRPLTPQEAVGRVESWFGQPCMKVLQPTERHWDFFRQAIRAGDATGNLVSDAHLVALALEHNCTLHSTDTDFARFRGLKWRNPLLQE
jgi:toxin-antitoxin system PIN domain toxin